MLIVFARSFRLLATFAIVLEVRGISFFQILWTTLWQKFVGSKDHNRPSMSSPCYIVTLPAQPFCMGYPEEMLSFARHTNLCIHDSERYMFLWVVPLSCLPTLFYQLIVKSMRAIVHRFLLLLWSVKPFYSGMTRRNKLQYLIHTQDWVLTVVFRRSNSNPAFGSVLPWSITPFMSELSWELHQLSWILT